MDNMVNARKSFTYTANNIITKLQTKFNSIGSVVVELSAQDFIIAGSNRGMVDSFLLLKSSFLIYHYFIFLPLL